MAQLGQARLQPGRRSNHSGCEDACAQPAASVFSEKEPLVQALSHDLVALLNDHRFQADKAQLAVGAWESVALCVHSRSVDLFLLRQDVDENRRAGLVLAEVIDFDHPVVAAVASSFARCFLALDESGCLHCVDDSGVLIFSRNVMDAASHGRPASMRLLPGSSDESVEDIVITTEQQWVYVLSGVNLALLIRAARAKDKAAMQEGMRQLKVQHKNMNPSGGAAIVSVARSMASPVVFTQQDGKLLASFVSSEQAPLELSMAPDRCAEYLSRTPVTASVVLQAQGQAHLATVHGGELAVSALGCLHRDSRVLAGYDVEGVRVLLTLLGEGEQDRIIATRFDGADGQQSGVCLCDLTLNGRVLAAATSWDGAVLIVQTNLAQLQLLHCPFLKMLQTSQHVVGDIVELLKTDTTPAALSVTLEAWAEKGRHLNLAAVLASVEATLDCLQAGQELDLSRLQEIAKCAQSVLSAAPTAQQLNERTHRMLANMEAAGVASCAMSVHECWQLLRTSGSESLVSKLCMAGQWKVAVGVAALYLDELEEHHLQSMLRHIPKALPLETHLNLATMYAAVMRDGHAALALLAWANRMLAAGHGELSAMDCAALAAHVLELVGSKSSICRAADVAAARDQITTQAEVYKKLALLEMYLSQKIPIEEYEAHTVQFACDDAIDDAPVEGVAQLVERKIRPMAAEMGVCCDQVLVDYIHHQLHSDSSEQLANRVIEVTKCIRSESTRAVALLTLLRGSILPRQQLSTAAEIAETLLHVCSASVREQLSEAIRVVRLTAVSFTYGILGYDALNTHHAREIVRVIVSSDIPTCLEDAIQFTKAYASLPAELVFVDFTEHAMNVAASSDGDVDPAHSKRALSTVDDAIHKAFTMLNDNASLNRYVEEMVAFCSVTMDDLARESLDEGRPLGTLASPAAEAEFRVAAHTATALCTSLLDRIKLRGLQATSWVDLDLLTRLRTVTMLAKECQLFISVDVLLSEAEKLARVKLLLDSSISSAVNSVLATKSISGIPSCMARARRACDLLHVDWSVAIARVCTGLIQEGSVNAAVNVAVSWLKAVDSDGRGAASMACDLGLQLSRLAMKDGAHAVGFSELFALSYSLMSHAAIRADPEALRRIADFIHASDVMIDFCIRCGECEEDPRFKLRAASADTRGRPVRLDSTFFRRDGVVLQMNAARPLMFTYLGAEVKLRGQNSVSSSAKRADKANIIDHLIDHDNMGFALRLLMSSWYIDEEALEEIVRPYAIKIVSSDTFDSALAVSTLSILSQPQTMKVLREVIPRVRNDFKRLQMLAVVGSELASLWSHNEFSFMCEQLERNTHWWRVLSNLGIDFDPNCFGGLQPNHGVTGPRVDEHLRQLIPLLLDKTNLDVALALEFCQHYQIEESAVAVHYIEHVLLIDQTTVVEEIRRKLDTVLASVQEARLVSLLRQILSRLAGDQYERIELVCHLLLESELEDEAEALTYNQYVQMLRVLLSYMEWQNQRGASHPRIHFWRLLEDPWGVLAKVMLRDDDRGLRLLSLCEPLRLRTDEFYLKLIMVHADEKAKELAHLQQTQQTQQQQQQSTSSAAGALVLSSSTALDEMVPYIDLVVDKTTRQEAWIWLFERFKTISEATAVYCVTRAVEEIGAVPESDPAFGTLEELLAEREILRNAIAVSSIDGSYRERFRDKLSDTEELVRELVHSCANDWATQTLRGLSLLRSIDDVLSGLQATVKAELSDKTSRMQRAIASIVPKSFSVQEFIQSSVMAWLYCPLHDAAHDSNDRTRSLSSIWLNARPAAQSCFSATAMEERKRQDLHNALCICFVLFADSARVSSWLERLLETIKGSKSGRITHRSRLRLLVAAFFLVEDARSLLEFTDSLCTELQLFQLLGESEVLRLPYSATSLQLTFRDAESLCKTLWRDAKSSSISGVLELLSDVIIMHKASSSSVLEDMLMEVRRSQSGRLFLNIMAGFCTFAQHLPTFRTLAAECSAAVLQELEERCRRLREVYVVRDASAGASSGSPLDVEICSIPFDEVKLVLQQTMLMFSQTRTMHTRTVEASVPTILQAIQQLRARCTSKQAVAVLDGISSEVCRFAIAITTSPFSHATTREVLYNAIALHSRDVATQLIVQSGQISHLLNPVLSILWQQHRQAFEDYVRYMLDSTCQSLYSWPVWHAFTQWLANLERAAHDATQNVIDKWVADQPRPEGFVAELKQQLAAVGAARS